MANYDRADCIRRLQRALARPTTDAELPLAVDSLADELLCDAQIEVAERLAMEVPESNYAPIALTSAGGGDTNKLFQTASASVEWIGTIELYRDSTLRGLPLSLGAFWDPRSEFTVEGSRGVRLSCGRTKAYPTLTARAFVKPLNATSYPPSLVPATLQRAVVQLAAAEFCDRGGKRNPAPFLRRYERIYANAVTAMKPNQSTGVGGGRGWWNQSGDLGRLAWP